MATLFKNGKIVNVFTGEIIAADVTVAGNKIISVGCYGENADNVIDVTGKYICPGFIEGHIHIESTMMTPAVFAGICAARGTTTVIADPHEIANVCGTEGIDFMIGNSKNLPIDIYYVMPSCVPASKFDESKARLSAEDIKPYYEKPEILGLGEVMNYALVLAGDKDTLKKINDAKSSGKAVNGHAPRLTGKDLDKYISAGIGDDHECATPDEAKERIRKGQRVMIRQGTAAKNLDALLPLFDEPWAHRCLLVSDDKHPAELLKSGHIDDIIRQAVQAGKSAVTAIRMATLYAAECFGLKDVGAVAPGYKADFIVLEDLNSIKVAEVYKNGVKVSENGKSVSYNVPYISESLREKICLSVNLDKVFKKDFFIGASGVKKCRVIKTIRGELLTEEWITALDFDKQNGIDIKRDIVKIAVLERHSNTGHRFVGFISGTGLKEGAVCSSVSHDSHNLIVIGVNESDMALAVNRVRELGGGLTVVKNGAVIAEMALPIAGLMSNLSAEEIAAQNENVMNGIYGLGISEDAELLMTMAFISLTVIPDIKICTKGLVLVNEQKIVSLFDC